MTIDVCERNSAVAAEARLLLDRALGLLPRAGDPVKAQYWAGLRPVTPDSVPILGSQRCRSPRTRSS